MRFELAIALLFAHGGHLDYRRATVRVEIRVVGASTMDIETTGWEHIERVCTDLHPDLLDGGCSAVIEREED